VGEPSDSSPSVLDGHISEADLARQLNRSVRTLQRLASRQLGPPRTKVGRLILYNVAHVREWLLEQEEPRKLSSRVRQTARNPKRPALNKRAIAAFVESEASQKDPLEGEPVESDTEHPSQPVGALQNKLREVIGG
jgi:hypothetical protein